MTEVRVKCCKCPKLVKMFKNNSEQYSIDAGTDWAIHATVIGILSVLFMFATICNSIVFVIFYRRPSLRSISNRFVLSLISANLVASLIVIPAQAVRVSRQLIGKSRHLIGECLVADEARSTIDVDWICQGCRITTTLATQAAILSILIIAIDRYCAVTTPLHYPMSLPVGKSIRLIATVWIVAMVYAMPPVFIELYVHNHRLPDKCSNDFKPQISHRFGVYYSITMMVLGFLVPFVALVWIYVKMYGTAQRNSERTRRHSVCASQTEVVLSDCPSTPDTGGHHFTRSRTRIHRKRMPNATMSSLFFREEGKAMKTAVLVIMPFCMCWLPYYLYKVFEATFCYDPHLQNAIVLLALSSTCTTPFIYVYRNDAVRREAIKVVCWWKSSSSATPIFHDPIINHHTHVNGSRTSSFEPDCRSLYSYSSECKDCSSNNLISAIRPYRPMSTPVHNVKSTTHPQSDNLVSFKVSPEPRKGPCRNCFQHSQDSSNASDDSVICDKVRYSRNSYNSTRLMRHRLSNGSVGTRSDSLVSTNSSIFSNGVHRWPRRCSTLSTDSGGTFSRRSTMDDPSDSMSSSGTPKYHLRICHNEWEDGRDDAHGYPNPLRNPRIYRRQESICSNHHMWGIEETKDETIVVEQGDMIESPIVYVKEHDKPMISDRCMKHPRLLKKRFSDQELIKRKLNDRRLSATNLSQGAPFLPPSNNADLAPYLKVSKNVENMSIKLNRLQGNSCLDCDIGMHKESSAPSYTSCPDTYEHIVRK